jgi:hypothetical protein
MSEPPDQLTNQRDRMTWRNIERCLQAHCGNDADFFRDREESFMTILNLMASTIKDHHAENDKRVTRNQ